MTWEVEVTDEFVEWYRTLQFSESAAVDEAITMLEGHGPMLGRPLADTLQGSRLANLKELRPLGGSIRILFAFDPRRVAILLLGGDKSGQWQSWYQVMIPKAEQLYDDHLAQLRREGLQ